MQNQASVNIDSSPSLSLYALGPIASSDLLRVDGRIGRRKVRILIDGGAKGNFISLEIVKAANLRTTDEPSYEVTLADGSKITATVVPDCTLKIKDYQVSLDLLATPIAHDVILGKAWLDEVNPRINWRLNEIEFDDEEGHHHLWTTFEDVTGDLDDTTLSATQLKRIATDKDVKIWVCILKDIDEFHQAVDTAMNGKPEYLRRVLDDHDEVFSGVTGMPPPRDQDHSIELVEGSKPPWQPTYHMSDKELGLLKEELTRLMKLGHIRRSTSPYGAPVFFVEEKTGKIRMVTDYRALNKLTVKNRTALPNILEMLDRLKDAKVFTKIDLQSGFHLIRVSEGDIAKTAFRTKYGHFEFTVMPFGLCNAPATFQSNMNAIFADLLDECVVVYLDDLLIYSRTHEEHEVHLRKVLQKMVDHKLRARVHKCRFLTPTVDYLGYIIGNGEIRPDPKKLEAVKTWPPPRDVHELRSFLGMANTLLRFTPMFADLSASLTDLLRGAPAKTAPLDWKPEHQKDFDALKKILTTSPNVLSIPDANLPMILHTDWSLKAIGGWIGQEDITGKIQPIAFESRKLRPAERNYSPYDGELLALVHCLRIFRPYIHGKRTIVRTDQKALRWLLDQKTMSRRQYRWLDDIQSICPELQWIKGSENTIADALSRKSQEHEIGVQVNVIDTIANSLPFYDDVRSKTQEDDPLRELIKTVEKGKKSTRYSYHDGLLWYEGNRLVIPKSLRLSLLQDNHDSPTAGHPSRAITYDLLARHYHWPGMEKDVRKYIKSCEACQRFKDSTQRPGGLLQPLPIPERPWASISMDFITHLPKTKKGFDAITVFVDRLTKMVHLCPGKTTDNAPEVATQFLNTIFVHHGLPAQIVSDRDTRFTGSFWKQLMTLLKVQVSMSTAFHPQTDGQTERMNRTVEQVLRIYVDYRQKNWDELLPLVEFAINNHSSSSTGSSPFFLNSGLHPLLPVHHGQHSDNPTALTSHQQLDANLTLAKDLLRKAQDTQKHHANLRRRDLEFSPDDMVLLDSEHVTVDNQRNRPSKKLAAKYIGPYRVLERIGAVAYKLELPDSMRIHPVFHVSRLKTYTDPSSFSPLRAPDNRPPPVTVDDVEEYEIEKIVDHRLRHGQRQYLVHWLGYDATDDTWLSADALTHAPELVDDYEDELPLNERYPSFYGGGV